MTIKQVSNGNPDGVTVGQNAADKVGFHGATPVAQAAAIASLTDSSGGTAGDTIADVPATYTEATLANQLASLTAKINAILTALRNKGIIAS